MDVHDQPDGSLLITHDSSLWAKWLVAGTLVLLGTAAYDHFIGARGDDRMIALLASAATLAVMALATLEQVRFHVDPKSRVIDWDRRWGFKRRAGITPFDAVQHVSVEVPIGDSGVPNRRIVLHLANGTLLPMTAGYSPDNDNVIAGIVDRLRTVLGQPAPTLDESLRMRIAAQDTIGAVKLLREKEGLSLTDAKRRIEDMGRDANGI